MKILKHFSSKRSLYYQDENTQAGISPKRKILTLSAVFLTAAVLFACVLFLADTPPKCNVKMPILMYHDLTLYPE